MKNWLSPLQLEGQKVKLIPMEESHKQAYLGAAADGKLWELWYTSVPSKDSIDKYVGFALSEQEKGNALPFSVLDKKSDKIIGSTRYCSITPQHRRLEIGYTWYAKSYQRTAINTECKYLLLKYAFEDLNCIAVEFKTNWFNMGSRRAIARLGAKQDGVLRNHRLMADGSTRDTVIFSITKQEWAGVKKSLLYEMNKYDG